MIYNVAQLLREVPGTTRQYPIEGALTGIDENNPSLIAVGGEVVLVRTDSGVLAMGTARMALVRACRRCLELASQSVEVEFEEEFVPSIDVETGRSLDTSEAAEELVINDQHLLDLTEVLRQYAVMEAVRGTLCADDCLGLCPVCGQSLNQGDCGCDRSHVDPRMAPLLALLDKEETE